MLTVSVSILAERYFFLKPSKVKILLEKGIDKNFSDSQKLDYLTSFANYQILNEKDIDITIVTRLVQFIGYTLIVSFVILCIAFLIRLPSYRFILFTEKSQRDKKNKLKIAKKIEVFSILGIVASIVSGVLANYVFKLLQ